MWTSRADAFRNGSNCGWGQDHPLSYYKETLAENDFWESFCDGFEYARAIRGDMDTRITHWEYRLIDGKGRVVESVIRCRPTPPDGRNDLNGLHWKLAAFLTDQEAAQRRAARPRNG